MEVIARWPASRCVHFLSDVNHEYNLIYPGIRNFVVGVTVKVASDETTLRKEKTYINKLNLALVQVRV